MDIILTYRTIGHLRYALAGAYCVQLYEWIALARLEWKLVHRAKRWSSIKAAYLLCRYYPLIVCPVIMWAYLGNYTATSCERVVRPVNALLTPFQFIAQGVMLIRAHAFTGRKPKILALLLFFYFILIGVDIWVFCINNEIPPRAYYQAVGGTGCFPDHGTGMMHVRIGLVKIAAVTMDLVSLAVVLVHCQREYRSQGVLVTFFVNQGLGAFASITAINLGCAIFYYQPNSAYDRIGLPFILVVPNVLACRVILHLRDKARPTLDDICRNNSAIVRVALGNCDDPSDQWTLNDPVDIRG